MLPVTAHHVQTTADSIVTLQRMVGAVRVGSVTAFASVIFFRHFGWWFSIGLGLSAMEVWGRGWGRR